MKKVRRLFKGEQLLIKKMEKTCSVFLENYMTCLVLMVLSYYYHITLSCTLRQYTYDSYHSTEPKTLITYEPKKFISHLSHTKLK